MHGGLDAPNRETLPVVGQKQIHNRIQQLNFRDCHAKISQVRAFYNGFMVLLLVVVRTSTRNLRFAPLTILRGEHAIACYVKSCRKSISGCDRDFHYLLYLEYLCNHHVLLVQALKICV